jgi:outer membrane protein, multidrug efflux system
MAPAYVRPATPVPASWPTGDAYLRQSEASLPQITGQTVFRDARLLRLFAIAAENNRDLRIAAANVAAARASYRIQRASQLPVIGAGAGITRSDGGTSGTSSASGTRFSASIGITSFEIDLFGRVASLTRAEQERYFATEAGARATRIALTGEIADAWSAYAADAALLRIAADTVRIAERSVTLTRARLTGGIAPRTDLRQAEQVLETARADVAEQKTALAQDVNALQLLLGAPVPAELLAGGVAELDTAFAAPAAGLDSLILLRRPDVLQAEFELRAANANIGAARAALFPRISLTGLLGLASGALGALFEGGSFNWQAGADASAPIFSGGAGRAGVAQARAQRDAALAQYERAIQIAFRETADALARAGTIEDQLAANNRLVDAARDTQRLSDARYRGGIDSFLANLDAQRSAYAAERTLVSTQLVRAQNRTALYRALAVDPL